MKKVILGMVTFILLLSTAQAYRLPTDVKPASAAPSDGYVGALNYEELRQQEVQPNGPVRMTADLLVARPLLLGATVAGTAFFIVSLPFSILGGNVGESAEHLIGTPLKAALSRCLGCEN